MFGSIIFQSQFVAVMPNIDVILCQSNWLLSSPHLGLMESSTHSCKWRIQLYYFAMACLIIYDVLVHAFWSWLINTACRLRCLLVLPCLSRKKTSLNSKMVNFMHMISMGWEFSWRFVIIMNHVCIWANKLLSLCLFAILAFAKASP